MTGVQTCALPIYSDRARFFRIVNEVTLGVVGRVLADDFDGVLVRAHRAVGAESVKQGANHAVALGRERGIVIEAGVAYIIVDADCEMGFWLGPAEIVVDRLDHSGSEFFRGESVAAADDLCGTLGFMQRIDDVEVERLAGRSGFLRAVEDGDLLYRSGQRIPEMLHREGAIEADFEEADFFPAGGESFDGFMSGLSAGTHHDDDTLGIGGADV